MALSTGAWIAIALGGVAVTGVVVYAVTRPAATNAATPAAPPPLTGPAILPGQSVSTLNNAAQTALNVQQAEAAAAAATAAAAKAATDALVTNTTYQLVVSGSQNIQLKVGDTIRLIPSMTADPPLATQWSYTPDASNASSVLAAIGSTNGADEAYQAMGPGFVTLIVKNTDVATGQTVFANYDVGITVVSA